MIWSLTSKVSPYPGTYLVMGRVVEAAQSKQLLVDVSQCPSRRPWNFSGILPGITTKARIVDIYRRVLISPAELLSMHGFPSVNMSSLSREDAYALAGNALITPVIAVAMLACMMVDGWVKCEDVST
jgi:hypothetical protein